MKNTVVCTFAIAAAVSFGGTVFADPATAPVLPPTPGGAVDRPNWIPLPDRDSSRSYYPEQARRAGLSGTAQMKCQVAVDGHVENCVVLSEDPPGYRFGEMAVSMAPEFKMKPAMKDGVPVGGATVIIPVRFQLPPVEPAYGASPPSDASTPKPTPTLAKPQWIKWPNADDIADYYPDRARREAVTLRGVLFCKVTAEGTLTGCVVESEGPPDYGLGDAMLAISAKFKMKPVTDDGRSVEGLTVRLPIVFAPPQY